LINDDDVDGDDDDEIILYRNSDVKLLVNQTNIT